MRAVVVGGGIGGLAAAVALHRAGWDVRVYERRAEPGEIGAGISLWPNAVAALDRLQVWPDIRAAAAMPLGGARRPDGRWLFKAETNSAGQPLFEVLLVHRAQLHERLLAALPPDTLVPGIGVLAASRDGVVTRGGETERADVVVAADGLYSTIRASLRPDSVGPRFAGFTAWRGVTEHPFPLGAGAETLGRGAEFGATIMLDGHVYWYATANRPEGERALDEHGEVLRRFGDWHAPIADIIRATPPEAVLRHDMYSLPTPLPSFVEGQVAFVGDAAHAMTPNMGQGGCQALEDAVVLGALLRDRPVDQALDAYDAQRRRRAEKIVNASLRMSRIYQSENRFTVTMRDFAARVVPPRLATLGLRRTIAWTPPE